MILLFLGTELYLTYKISLIYMVFGVFISSFILYLKNNKDKKTNRLLNDKTSKK